jgi:chaperonin GroEL
MITSNVMTREETTKVIGETMEYLANILSRTLGPYGSTTIVQDRQLQHFMTKDGYSVLKQIMFKEELPKTVLDLVKNISKNLVRTVGDGSTSSIIVSAKLFNDLLELPKEFNIAPKDVVDMLNVAGEIFARFIKRDANKINDNMDRIEDIATISTNNDRETGKLIAEIFKKVGRHGFINIELGKGKDRYEVTSGTEVTRGYIDYTFANLEDKRTFEGEDALIFMCNGTLGKEDLPLVSEVMAQVCLQFARPLIFVAKDYDSYFKTFLHENKMKNRDNLQICAIDIPVESEASAQKFNDLAIAIGATVYDKREGEKLTEWGMERFGMAKKVIINDMKTKFIEGAGKEDKIAERVAVIQKEYDKLAAIEDYVDREELLYGLRKRMASLQKSMAVLYVGGATEAEKNTRRFLIEDAIYACQSALEHGYVVGGNLVLPRILRDKDNFADIAMEITRKMQKSIGSLATTFLNLIAQSFEHSYKTVLANANYDENKINSILRKCVEGSEVYNLKLHRYETDEETLVINSAETDIEIIKASFSIIGLLVTSNQFLALSYNENN